MTKRGALSLEISRLQGRIQRDRQLGRRTGALEAHLCALVVERMRLGTKLSKRQRQGVAA